MIQFSCSIYYCDEDEGTFALDINRIGDLSQASEVQYRTRDGSAHAGVSYVTCHDTLVFEPGEFEKTVHIQLIPSSLWTPTIEFKVELLPLNMKNAFLNHHVHSCRIKIIDIDSFPSSRFEDAIRQRLVADIPKVPLFLEYVKLNLQNPVVSERAKSCIIIDQLHNIYMFLQLFVNVYLVDYVLNQDCENLVFVNSRHEALVLIFCAKLLPLAALHLVDHVKVARFGTGPASLKTLKAGLLRKFLNSDRVARGQVNQGDLIMSLTRDSNLVVHEGFDNVLMVIQQLGQLVATLVYQIVAPFVFGKPFSIIGFVPLLVFPCAMLTFLVCRMPITGEHLEVRNQKQNKLVDYVAESVNNYRLIADYMKRDKCVDDFEEFLLQHAGSMRNCGIVLSNNHYFTTWLMTAVVAFYTFVGGSNVIGETQSLGMFLTNVHIFALIGGSWAAIYDKFLTISTTFPALERIVNFMNLPMDVGHRKALNRKRREATVSLQRELQLRNVEGMDTIDLMPIVVGNLHFSYVTGSLHGSKPWHGEENDARVTRMNTSGTLEVRQGEFCVLAGPNSGGKATLLRILGGEILPNPEDVGSKIHDMKAGQLFVPSHLRVLQVQPTPMFSSGTLLENLAFGVMPGHDDGRLSRVLAICEKLGIAPDVVRHTEKNEKHRWVEVLSSTQCQQLSIARALVANPEILCLHKPTQIFDDELADLVGTVLREFVDSRGLANASTPHERLRPRTCIVTVADQRRAEKYADRLYHVSQEDGIRLVDLSRGDTAETEPRPFHDPG